MTRKLLIPVDVTESELAHTIITHTQNESRFDTAEIHFLSVVQPFPYYPALGGRHSVHIPSIDELVDDARKTLEKTVRNFELPDVKTFVHVIAGSPKDKILEMAEKLSIDLIIISSRRDKFTKFLLGSTTSAVVRHAECPVLVVR
ncbi:universal stress protein UspF [Citrobacter rodentium]|jgi:Universal stress protein UspA and related nucleotide-binding proteins|uniref:Universal stress protein F n=2 Tax=Citrobacter rodentium TaxID=67825 RepID=D2TMQ1_CITRI|nr:universal stress protein UspF [Citrobacter rodentium]KIQ50942.1 universal stress protein F [Citrobacter rodentium]QBY31835.1 universal stress protein UspF [Citrobacter rodentium]UHO30811.1 universal stress protein UspF [Citrobacter rodentium NBRC 105723 = DSM 16636]CBG87396.1 universal stress protein f [Citrobacter rodentium ICC168]HAT8013547.1 universal stress protein F [Citrobacter rodentium NBRC 105723 = DSM 16636]